MAKKSSTTQSKTTDSEAVRQPVRSKSVTAGDCPKHPGHTQTQVYRTQGKTRYCKCNDCGTTWKVIGEAAGAGGLTDDDRLFLLQLADGLTDAERTTVEGVEVICFNVDEAETAAERLQKIA